MTLEARLTRLQHLLLFQTVWKETLSFKPERFCLKRVKPHFCDTWRHFLSHKTYLHSWAVFTLYQNEVHSGTTLTHFHTEYLYSFKWYHLKFHLGTVSSSRVVAPDWIFVSERNSSRTFHKYHVKKVRAHSGTVLGWSADSCFRSTDVFTTLLFQNKELLCKRRINICVVPVLIPVSMKTSPQIVQVNESWRFVSAVSRYGAKSHYLNLWHSTS